MVFSPGNIFVSNEEIIPFQCYNATNRAKIGTNDVTLLKQGIASDTIPSHCTILLTGLIAGWILIS